MRGINKSPHQQEVINFISANHISLMGLVETKVRVQNSNDISRRINKKCKWIFNYEVHEYGRVWVGWDPSIWSVHVHMKSSQHVTCFVTFLEKQISFCVTFVYALNKPHQREHLWREMDKW